MPRMKPLFAIAGTLPAEHNLDEIRRELLDDTRHRHWALVEIRSTHTGTDHPDDEPDLSTSVVSLLSLWVVRDPAALDQIQAMAKAIRDRQPGQGVLAPANEAGD